MAIPTGFDREQELCGCGDTYAVHDWPGNGCLVSSCECTSFHGTGNYAEIKYRIGYGGSVERADRPGAPVLIQRTQRPLSPWTVAIGAAAAAFLLVIAAYAAFAQESKPLVTHMALDCPADTTCYVNLQPGHYLIYLPEGQNATSREMKSSDGKDEGQIQVETPFVYGNPAWPPKP